MRIHLGSDHAGLSLKQKISDFLSERGHELVDHGAISLDPNDDYPAYCFAAAEGTVADKGSLGIVIGGSGNGEAIAANKVPGARCALAYSEDTARLGREHNDANVMSLGARLTDESLALRLVEIFIKTPFSGEDRHLRRIAMLADYDRRPMPDL
jgi:ribose 5-phosphate isomerase B